MNVNGKIIVFVNEREGKNGKFNSFCTKIGTEGKLYANVRFAKTIPSDKLEAGKAYTLEVTKAFLTNDIYNEKDYLTLVVQEAKVVKASEVKNGKKEKQEENFPF